MTRLLFFGLFVCFSQFLHCQSWEEAQSTGKAQLNVYWYTSQPFIYQNEIGELVGIEYDLLEGFKDYLKVEKNIDLQVNWIKAEDFSNILDLSKKGQSNFIGISAFSITDDRKKFADFSVPYLPDVTVLVSSQGTEIVRSLEEINQMMQDMTAVTVKDTQYEKLLKDLESRFGLDFDRIYIKSDQNVLDNIAKANDRFGFIDLPIYLMLVQKGGELVRQNFFTVKGQGYGYLMSQNTDWKEPLDEYITYAHENNIISEITINYMGEEVYNFLEKLYGAEEIGTSILTKEKELQLELIKQANLQLEEEQSLKSILIIGIIIIGLFLLVIGYLFYKNQRTTQSLILQKDLIYLHQEDINLKNEQLINRNTQLMTINEEKNHLIKILAHDIRSPLSQISMIADLLKSPPKEMEGQTEEFLQQVTQNADRINEMVVKILDVDAIENNTMKVLRERIDLREILQDIKTRYFNTALKKKIELKVIPCENNYIIRTDHLLLTLVLENLVSNAIKFSPLKKQVTLAVDCKYDEVTFKISDEGPGFTEEDKKLAFNKFQKLSAKPTAGESSVGLGLSIVKQYVGEMGGEVWIESEEGKGSTFYVKLSV